MLRIGRLSILYHHHRHHHHLAYTHNICLSIRCIRTTVSHLSLIASGRPIAWHRVLSHRIKKEGRKQKKRGIPHSGFGSANAAAVTLGSGCTGSSEKALVPRAFPKEPRNAGQEKKSANMRIGCLQFNPQVGDVDNNLSRADSVLLKANPDDLDLLVLPELAFTGECDILCHNRS